MTTLDQPSAESPSEATLPLSALVESLLFAAGAPVSLRQLAEALDCSLSEVETAVQALQEACRTRGVQVQRHGELLQLVTAPAAASYVERLLGLSGGTGLSPAALETLAIIAYKQPITRPEIEAIRGVNSDSVLRTLLSKGLIQEVGRLETVGRPILFGTTFEFLQYFGLGGLDELPPLEDVTDKASPEDTAPAAPNGSTKLP
ncbi:MAG: SMC-Scp complex subunit ScpB [Ardenticatenia bacterium]|jgi:segregation and condensation protein B|nr:MAG: SMC-Scp complex subunit ScpB [Ardenticatenia bacterium]